MDSAKNGVLNEEMRRKSQSTSSTQSDALVYKSRGRNKSRDPANKDSSRSNSRGRYKNVECYHCGQKGRIKKFCWKLKKENKANKDKGKKKEESSDEDRVNATHEDFLLVQEFESMNLVDTATSWVVDSGASIHVTSDVGVFDGYKSPTNILKSNNIYTPQTLY